VADDILGLMNDIEKLLSKLAQLAIYNKRVLATAESCTGGLIAGAITSLPGSSAWFDRGFVTYSNEAKMQMLGVSVRALDDHGAVSEASVLEMAEGALRQSDADLAVSVSGVAGPDGGSPEKPVGTVWIACASSAASVAEHHLFAGDRLKVRQAAIGKSIDLLIRCIESDSS